MSNLCDPKVLSITLTQNPEILDRCLNGGLFMGSFECIMNNEQFEYETRLNPQALPRQLYVKPSSFLSLGV